jgi:hypothetical protein
MKLSLLVSHFVDQELDAINGPLIGYPLRDAVIAFDPLVEIPALLTHVQFRAIGALSRSRRPNCGLVHHRIRTSRRALVARSGNAPLLTVVIGMRPPLTAERVP